MPVNKSSGIIIREATENDIPLIHDLAHKVWPNTYCDILSSEQMDYMLEQIYSLASLQKQVAQGHNFLIAEESDKPIAFADYNHLKEGVCKLQKIYVLPDQQGKSTGKLLISYIIQKIKKEGATALLLNVNRNNKAKQFYEHLGFKVIGEEDIDIGNGFFMNDYIMHLSV